VREFTRDDFKQCLSSKTDEIFKLAARSQIDKLSNISDRVKLSIDFQILCPDTAFIGILKQNVKVDIELASVKLGDDNTEEP
jgi:hypothetical protein